MTNNYKVHIYIAEGGTPLLDPAYKDKTIPTGKTSIAGHMWYSIQKGDEPEESYGFASVNGKIFDKGQIVINNNDVYYKPRYKRTLIVEK